MDKNRLKKIISYSETNGDSIISAVREYCTFAGIDHETEILNILQIARDSFLRKGFLTLEMPFDDEEIGALCYRGDALGYVVINTSLPRVNVNFAIAHEIYHVFFGTDDSISKVEFSSNDYYVHEDEFAANLFAGILLMPATSFSKMFDKFMHESHGDLLEVVIKLLTYYQVPYTSVIIRCFELNYFHDKKASEDMFNLSKETITRKMDELWLDTSILEPSYKDDYRHIEGMLRKFGNEYIQDNYLNRRALEKAISNIDSLYQKIKGGSF